MTGCPSFGPIEKAVYNAEEAAVFLGLDSVRSLERLVQTQSIAPKWTRNRPPGTVTPAEAR